MDDYASVLHARGSISPATRLRIRRESTKTGFGQYTMGFLPLHGVTGDAYGPLLVVSRQACQTY
jgi:hypothetical protein